MNILFIGGDGNHPNANSVCVYNMAHEMMRRGHRVWILSMGDKYVINAGHLDDAELWHVPDNYYGKLVDRTLESPSFLRKAWFILFSFIRHLYIIPTYPNAAPFRAKKVARKAEDIINKNDISLVVAIFNRFENIYSGMRIKNNKGKTIKVVSYHLDLRTASINPSAWVRKYIYNHALASILEENKVVDKMLIPFPGQKDIEKIAGIDFSKIKYVGLPVFTSRDVYEVCDLPYDADAINISYMGSLSPDNRNPHYILSLLEKVQSIINCKVMVHFWGETGGVESLLVASPIAIYHGRVDNRYVSFLMKASDFLLNIGNAIAFKMLPSKIFGMFATGKPIINVVTNPHDATIPYFSIYDNSIDIKEYLHSENDVELLAEGIVQMLNSPTKEVKERFNSFKPETICDIILS